jgi:hypothetical protein
MKKFMKLSTGAINLDLIAYVYKESADRIHVKFVGQFSGQVDLALEGDDAKNVWTAVIER